MSGEQLNISQRKSGVFQDFFLKKYSLFKNPKRKRLLIFVFVLCLIVLFSLVYSFLPLQGRLLTVTPQEFSKGFTEEAQVLPSNELLIYNQVDGKIKTISVQNGDQVKKGQVLLEIDTVDLSYQLSALTAQLGSIEGQRQQTGGASAEANINQQRLLLEQAEKDALAQEQSLNRAKALYGTGAISLVQFEEEERLNEKARNNLAQQKNALELLNHNKSGSELYFDSQKNALSAQISQLTEKIKNARISAPQDGYIKDLTFKEGSMISLGQYLLSVYQNQGYKLESYVLASDVLGIRSGDPVELVQDTGDGKKP